MIAICIHAQGLKVDMLNRSWVVTRKVHFYVFYNFCDLDLWPHDSKICGKHCAVHMHTWPSLQLEMSNGSRIIKGKVHFYVFYDLCDFWPWTLDLVVKKFVLLVCIHDQGFKLICSNRSWIIKGKVYLYVFYDLCDLWPWTSTLQNLISSLSLLYAYMIKVSTSYLYRF